VPDSLTFAVDVFRTVCDRFRSNAADLRLLVEPGQFAEIVQAGGDSADREWLKRAEAATGRLERLG